MFRLRRSWQEACRIVSAPENLRLYDDTSSRQADARIRRYSAAVYRFQHPHVKPYRGLEHLRHLRQTFEAVDLRHSLTCAQENLQIRVVTKP